MPIRWRHRWTAVLKTGVGPFWAQNRGRRGVLPRRWRRHRWTPRPRLFAQVDVTCVHLQTTTPPDIQFLPPPSASSATRLGSGHGSSPPSTPPPSHSLPHARTRALTSRRHLKVHRRSLIDQRLDVRKPILLLCRINQLWSEIRSCAQHCASGGDENGRQAGRQAGRMKDEGYGRRDGMVRW